MNVARLLILFFLFACNAEQVKINTGGIFAPVTFSVDNQDASGKTLDFGEHLLTDEPRNIVVKVHNKTQFPYKNLDLLMSAEGDSVPSITFYPTQTGEIKFPGDGGTCQSTLDPGKTCEIRLVFAPREGRVYNETLTLSFHNLVDPETHVAKITMIAGMPASLAFTNDITQYTFGDLIGIAKLPVVERADKPTYTEELEIVNAGGLPAKNLLVNLTQTCASTVTGTCPAGMNGAFTMTNNCPTKLLPGEKCKVNISYTPKNQDPESGPVPELKEINYRSTVNFGYIKDPKNASAALNAYFRSISTNIEARFKVPITTLSFENPIVSGNREGRSFRISNLGYREGEIKSLDFRDSGGALIGSCKAHTTSQYLECKSPANSILPLATFPFSIKDRNDCLTISSESPKYIDVGDGCVFDIFFQPSVTFLNDMNTEFLNLQPEVIFDSRWKGAETIVSNKLFNLSAKSKAAARLVLNSFRYDTATYTAAGNSPWEINLGRLTLQSPNYFKRKLMILTFKNIGSVEARNLSFKDASGRIISVGGTAVDLGAYNPKYYTSAIASESNCTVVAPNDTCSVTMMFAPIGMDTNEMEDANMFDATGADGKRYKGFQVTYTSGAQYTDVNRESDPDYPPQTVETRLKAQLIRKGMLMQLSDDPRNVTNIGASVNVAGDTIITHLYVQNIGTGPVPYFRLMNPPADIVMNYNVKILPTSHPVSLGAQYDCLAIGDEDFTYTVPSSATPESRAGNFSSLPKEESCVYTLQLKTTERWRYHNYQTQTFGLPTATNLEEGLRFFSRDSEAAGGNALWEFGFGGSGNLSYQDISIKYFDGDGSDPAATSSYGNQFILPNYTSRAVQVWGAKLIPHSFNPFLSATLYRPGFTYPTLSSTQPTLVVPETWFYGTGQNFNYVLNDAAQSSPFIQGDDSRSFVPSLAGFGNRANYDYIYYLGSFPQGSGAFNFNLGLRNFGNFPAKLLSYYVTPDPAFTVNSIPTTFPLTIPSNNDVTPLNFTFNPANENEHWMELDYEYEPGRKTAPLVYKSSTVASNVGTVGREKIRQKILVIAHVMQTGTHPQASLSVEDYEVVQNEGAPPTETIGTPYNVPVSWNTFTAPSSLVFDTIKLTNTPTTNDVYAKKRLTITNNSTVPMYGLRALYRPDVASSGSKGVPASFTTVSSETTCTSGINLNPGSSCRITLKYQPTAGDTTDNFILTMLYSAGSGRFLMQNTGITLFPRSPGQVVVAGRTTETINYKVSPTSSTTTRSSYPLTFGTTTLNVVPKTFSFDATSSTFQKLQLVNSQTTKASLLLAYQKYLSANSLRGYSPTNIPPTSVVPTAGEYRTFGGYDYAMIYIAKYADGSTRHSIEASRGCFFGDDENNSAVPAHQKGFHSTSATPCFIIVVFSANFEYLLKAILINNGDDMRGTAAELWYYSVNRSSTASIWVHVKGTINPDVSISSGSYANVKAFDNKTASFSVPKFTANNTAVGDIIGIRVLLSSSPTGLNNPYATTLTTYFDIRPYDPFSTQFANFISGLSNSQFFYFRAVAIRKDTRFVDGTPKRFVGLNPGEYLSLATNLATPLKVLVPPLNHFYFHDQKMVVDKSLTGGVLNEPYSTSSNRCVNRTKLLVKDPSNLYYSYQLIRKTTWDLLLANPSATSYSNMTQIAHWLNEATVSIDTRCSGLPGFLAGQSSQMLDSSSVFYIRNSSNPSANVNQGIGGVPGTTVSNYQSYVDGTIGFASARCMVVLP